MSLPNTIDETMEVEDRFPFTSCTHLGTSDGLDNSNTQINTSTLYTDKDWDLISAANSIYIGWSIQPIINIDGHASSVNQIEPSETRQINLTDRLSHMSSNSHITTPPLPASSVIANTPAADKNDFMTRNNDILFEPQFNSQTLLRHDFWHSSNCQSLSNTVFPDFPRRILRLIGYQLRGLVWNLFLLSILHSSSTLRCHT